MDEARHSCFTPCELFGRDSLDVVVPAEDVVALDEARLVLFERGAAHGAAQAGDVPAGLADLQQVPVADRVPTGGAHGRLRLRTAGRAQGQRSEVRG